MNHTFHKYIFIYMLFFVGFPGFMNSQSIYISLEKATQLARKNNTGLERDKLIAEQQKMLAEAGILQNPASIYFSGEEFDLDESGVQSINLEQSFYIPKAARAQREYYQSEAALAEQNLKLTDNELKWEVSKAYFQLLFLKEEEGLLHETVHFYEDFLEKTEAKIAAGETGKIPKLAASSSLGQARLELEHNEEQYQVALLLFNSWLQSDTLFSTSGSLYSPFTLENDSITNENLHLQAKQARVERSLADVARKESLLLPQINSGMKLQMLNGSLPYFGYQVGVNIPLFKGAYKKQIQAAKVGVLVEETAMKAARLELERHLNELRYRLDHQSHVLQYLENELKPIVEERHVINTKAFQAGEIGYLESLDGLEQLFKVKLQYLEALYKYKLLNIELDYWTSQ